MMFYRGHLGTPSAQKERGWDPGAYVKATAGVKPAEQGRAFNSGGIARAKTQR